jgi:serine/threonine protein kinase
MQTCIPCNAFFLIVAANFFSARQSCAGMICLANRGVVHRDLALRNVMVTDGDDKDRYFAKVGDMGLAKLNDDPETNDVALPIRWAAPECYLSKQFSTASDVWSFGILLHELFSFGAVPYRGMTNRQVIEKVPNGYRLDAPENCPSQVYDLMKLCWDIGGKNKFLIFSHNNRSVEKTWICCCF